MQLNQVTIPCVDYAASVAFYQALGLKLIVDAPPRYARLECAEGEGGAPPATLSLHQAEPSERPAYPRVYFEVDDVQAEVDRLKQLGISCGPVRAESWLWTEARLEDPAGNAVCLYHAGEARRFPPWRVEEV